MSSPTDTPNQPYVPPQESPADLQRKERHNARRRARYSSDPAYRDSVASRSRESYRKRARLHLRDCTDNIPRVRDFGTVRRISVAGEVIQALTLSVAEMATFLGGYHGVVVRRWTASQVFPPPVYPEVKDGTDIPGPPHHVYTEEQAVALAKVFSEHQRHKSALSRRDVDTIQRLYAAM